VLLFVEDNMAQARIGLVPKLASRRRSLRPVARGLDQRRIIRIRVSTFGLPGASWCPPLTFRPV
jgi:hypothetical protein